MGESTEVVGAVGVEPRGVEPKEVELPGVELELWVVGVLPMEGRVLAGEGLGAEPPRFAEGEEPVL